MASHTSMSRGIMILLASLVGSVILRQSVSTKRLVQTPWTARSNERLKRRGPSRPCPWTVLMKSSAPLAWRALSKKGAPPPLGGPPALGAGAPKLQKKGSCALTYRPYGRACSVTKDLVVNKHSSEDPVNTINCLRLLALTSARKKSALTPARPSTFPKFHRPIFKSPFPSPPRARSGQIYVSASV